VKVNDRCAACQQREVCTHSRLTDQARFCESDNKEPEFRSMSFANQTMRPRPTMLIVDCGLARDGRDSMR
jgi:hypothetical protein